MARQQAGLNRNYCRRHVDHFKRHGSYAKPSYSAAQLNPYRKSALKWLQEHAQEPCVQEAVDRVRTAYWRAGRSVAAFRLTGMRPDARAKVVWALLSERKVDPLQVLAISLGVSLCHQADAQPERKITYRTVQAAKVLHRLAGGTHKRWAVESDNGTEFTEIHRFPVSRGAVLRHIGAVASWTIQPLLGQLASLDAFHVVNTKRNAGRLPRARTRLR